jgi:hypothetical protein
VPVERLERRLEPRERRVERLAPRQEVLAAERLERLRVAVARAPERGRLGDATLDASALGVPVPRGERRDGAAAAGRERFGGGGIVEAGGAARVMSASTAAVDWSMGRNLTLHA